ncbi:unnamed protein product [Arabidopsis halleri]
MKKFGSLKYFLGIEVARSSKEIYLSQRKYGLSGGRPVYTPIIQNHKLEEDEVEYFDSLEKYRRLVCVCGGRGVHLLFGRPRNKELSLNRPWKRSIELCLLPHHSSGGFIIFCLTLASRR